MRKNRVVYPLLVCCLLLFFGSRLSSKPREIPKKSRLNVLLLTIDTLRPDRLGCYGGRSPRTPNIDGLADKGVLFTRAFAHSPMTLPSHADIFLGVTPLFHGVHDNNHFAVREELTTLAEVLKNDGYSTAAFVGAYPLDSRFGLNQGFDVYDDDYERIHDRKISTVERRADEVVGRALDWLNKQISPWFLWVHCYDPHDPYDPPEPFKGQFSGNPYNGEVAYVDQALEKLLDGLKKKGEFDQTLIIFTGDHGESLGQHEEATHGFFAYNSTLWVPLIMVVPGTPPSRVSSQVGHIDIFPTVCDLLHLAKPAVLQGTSLLPLIKGGRLPDKPLYFESLYPYTSRGWAPIRGYILENEKYVDSPLPEIYDLDQDFDELQNLARSKKTEKYAERLKEIVEKLTSPEAGRAERNMDRASLEKLRSLGYISGGRVSKKEKFGPEDDVKTLLPFNNKASRAMDLFEKGDTRGGIDLLREVIEKNKNLDSAYSNLALLYERQGRIQEALEVLKSGRTAIPSSYELFFNYVSFLEKARLFDEVVKAVGESDFEQVGSDPEMLNELGIAQARRGDLSKAVEIYEQALALDGKFPALYNNLGTAYLSLALRDNDNRAFKKSMESFKKAIELDPRYPLPYNGLGTVYRQAGDMEGAVFCWEKVLELNPGFSPALYNLGLVYMDKADFRRALRLLTEYRDKLSGSLPPKEREKLESLIQTCQSKIDR
ncbi:MAG: sulfatase-like hydrolase/transferase [Candidatus Aminicenantes bacterium]|nr:sulfatase-like hydrolase/transferase [Candidatus Aminicenantes bacterium]